MLVPKTRPHVIATVIRPVGGDASSVCIRMSRPQYTPLGLISTFGDGDGFAGYGKNMAVDRWMLSIQSSGGSLQGALLLDLLKALNLVAFLEVIPIFKCHAAFGPLAHFCDIFLDVFE